jgi:hypothetical protein
MADTKYKQPVKVPTPQTAGYENEMKGVKTDGVVTRGNGAATKGTKARGPLA